MVEAHSERRPVRLPGNGEKLDREFGVRGQARRGAQRLVGANPEHRVFTLALNDGGVGEGAELPKRVFKCPAEFLFGGLGDGDAKGVRQQNAAEPARLSDSGFDAVRADPAHDLNKQLIVSAPGRVGCVRGTKEDVGFLVALDDVQLGVEAGK